MIASEDITFVVQGAIDKINTSLCLSSIKKHFKNSKIILSTWEGSDVEGLDYDELILNKDPKGFKFSDKFYDNTNRQIVSSINGLRSVKTKYACKVRSDIILLSNSFLKFFDKFSKRSNSYILYKKRVLTYIFSCKFKHLDEYTPFHVGDWIFFGLTEDLIKMYDISLIAEKDAAFYNGFPKSAPIRFYKNPQKYFPEQYICYKPLEKNICNIGFQNRFYNDENIINISNEFIANNYIILSNFQMPIYFAKKNRNEYCNLDYEYFNNAIDYYDWLELYKKYCNKTFRYPKYKKKIYKKIIRIIYKNKHIKTFIQNYYKKLILQYKR